MTRWLSHRVKMPSCICSFIRYVFKLNFAAVEIPFYLFRANSKWTIWILDLIWPLIPRTTTTTLLVIETNVWVQRRQRTSRLASILDKMSCQNFVCMYVLNSNSVEVNYTFRNFRVDKKAPDDHWDRYHSPAPLSLQLPILLQILKPVFSSCMHPKFKIFLGYVCASTYKLNNQFNIDHIKQIPTSSDINVCVIIQNYKIRT